MSGVGWWCVAPVHLEQARERSENIAQGEGGDLGKAGRSAWRPVDEPLLPGLVGRARMVTFGERQKGADVGID